MTRARLSVPVHPKRLERELTPAEVAMLIAIGDVLIPASPTMPAPSQIEDFAGWLNRAMLALPHAFVTITGALADFAQAAAEVDAVSVRALSDSEPATFQAVSTVIAGAYLMVPDVRRRIGYPGQERNHPRFDEAADELATGIMDPVLGRGHFNLRS
jgi:hypothetical protein